MIFEFIGLPVKEMQKQLLRKVSPCTIHFLFLYFSARLYWR